MFCVILSSTTLGVSELEITVLNYNFVNRLNTVFLQLGVYFLQFFLQTGIYIYIVRDNFENN